VISIIIHTTPIELSSFVSPFPTFFNQTFPSPPLFPLLLLLIPLYCHNICHCLKMVLSPCLSSNHHSHFVHCSFTFLLSSNDLNQYIPKLWHCKLIHKVTYTFQFETLWRSTSHYCKFVILKNSEEQWKNVNDIYSHKENDGKMHVLCQNNFIEDLGAFNLSPNYTQLPFHLYIYFIQLSCHYI